MIIGKGTMGFQDDRSDEKMAVYLRATGLCAVCYGNTIQDVDVKWLYLGYHEAIWIFDMKIFWTLIVGIDSYGNSLTTNVMDEVFKNAYQIYEEEGLSPKIRYIQNPLTLAGLSLEECIRTCSKS